MKKAIFFFFTLFLFASCDKHIDPIDLSLKVGNIYCTDGSIVPPDQFRQSGKVAAAVIFHVETNPENEFRTYGIALEEVGKYYYSSKTEKVKDVSTNINDFKGSSNTAALLLDAKTNEYEVPAAHIASQYSFSGVTGYHLPAAGELKALAANMSIVDRSLKKINATPLSGNWYLSSTQDGESDPNSELYCLAVSLTEGRTISVFKDETYSVRPAISIR